MVPIDMMTINYHLLVVVVITRVARTGLLVTCMVFRRRCLPVSWFLNAVNTYFGELFGQGIGCTHRGKENTEETHRYICGRNNNESRAQANVRPHTPIRTHSHTQTHTHTRMRARVFSKSWADIFVTFPNLCIFFIS